MVGSVASQALNPAVSRPHPLCRQSLGVGVSGSKGGKPRIERSRVERPGHDALGVGAVGLRALAEALASVTEDSVPHFAAA